MKRVKFMLSAILVMAVVAAGLAFKVKTPDVCAYSTSNPNHASTCPTVTPGCTDIRTIQGTIFATTFACDPDVDCPLTTVCPGNRTLQTEL